MMVQGTEQQERKAAVRELDYVGYWLPELPQVNQVSYIQALQADAIFKNGKVTTVCLRSRVWFYQGKPAYKVIAFAFNSNANLITSEEFDTLTPAHFIDLVLKNYHVVTIF